MANLKITVLVENTANGPGLIAEHGLSFWIELGRKKILFDTGQGQALRHNAQRIHIPLESADSILLSHGHYDHTGGISDVLSLAGHPRVYVHPQAFAPKYACSAEGIAREIGMPEVSAQAIRSMSDPVSVEAPTEIGGGLWCTGPIPRMNEYEDTGGAFFKDNDCRNPDDLLDDQAAFLKTKRGTVVILGCAHAGVINTLHFIQTLTANHPIRAVIGGMHLLNANPQRLDNTITEMRRLEIELLMPGHCTGFDVMMRLWNEFPGQCERCLTGSVIEFQD
jgi:7,8-dihydropterin-6-yl-methyl-4-(beta-D-ribofuranosyl)aminobenzene 5'-phosphate synthase